MNATMGAQAMARTCLCIILAAGEGTRMKSQRPKVLHEVAGLPMAGHAVGAAVAAGADDIAVVVGHGSDTVRQAVAELAPQVVFFEQTQRLGTAHAVLAAASAIERGFDDIIVQFGDTPLLQSETLLALREALAGGAGVAILGFDAADPTGYGRLVMDRGELVAIREERDCSPKEREIRFCNGGIMAIDGRHALALLRAIGNDNAKSEYYLTDIVAVAREQGLSVASATAPEDEIMGVNNRADLALAESLWQARKRRALLLSGVTMVAPDTVYLSHDTDIAADVTLEPDVFFGPGVTIEAGAFIRGYSHLENCHIGQGAIIGPFARIRPGVSVGAGAKVGNFCELKNAELGEGAKVNHLTYIGDTRLGPRANIGAGTITCNYDGVQTYFTEIGEGAFVGSNSSLVAPLTIGKDAYVASGSVITDDVPADALAIARGRQAIKPGRAGELRAKLKAKKPAQSK